MGYLIGTDEAGYGPNLGPLVISATAWEAPDGVGGEDLFDRLGHVIAQKPESIGWETRKRGQSPFVRSTLRAVPANGDCPLFPIIAS